MNNILNEWNQFLNEEVYGNNATLYHSTKDSETIKSILNDGWDFDVKGVKKYGNGLYTVYDLQKSKTVKRGKYGNVLLKFNANLKKDDYIILDVEPNKKVYGKFKTLKEQADMYGISFSKKVYKKYKQIITRKGKRAKTHPVAKLISDELGEVVKGTSGRIQKIDGMLFTDNHDGPVCVVYNPEAVDLIAWKNLIDDSEWQDVIDGQSIINTLRDQLNEDTKETTFYHGSSEELEKGDYILPPEDTGVQAEKGRKKNLDKVFFTKDKGSAKIYADKARKELGGESHVYKVKPIGDVEWVNKKKGTTVLMAPKAKVVDKVE